MIKLTLNEEQTRTIATALEPVEIQDSMGNVLAVVQPVWTRDDLVRAKAILAAPDTQWFTSAQLFQHLRSLEV